MREFAAMKSVFNEGDPLVFLLEDETISITGPEKEIEGWRGYFLHGEEWPEHLKEESPLSSVFRGIYVSLKRHELTDKTRPLYEEMLESLSGETETVVVTLP